jgi:hypothetical protein
MASKEKGFANYRFDVRNEEEFIRDIKVGHEREQKAIELYSEFLSNNEIEHTIEPNGSDVEGKYIRDVQQVSKDADYLLNGEPLEVKTCQIKTETIYLKKRQIDDYIKQNSSVLFVMGIEEDEPVFTLMTPKDLVLIQKAAPCITPPRNINGGKLSYAFGRENFDFLYFDGRQYQ